MPGDDRAEGCSSGELADSVSQLALVGCKDHNFYPGYKPVKLLLIMSMIACSYIALGIDLRAFTMSLWK